MELIVLLTVRSVNRDLIVHDVVFKSIPGLFQKFTYRSPIALPIFMFLPEMVIEHYLKMGTLLHKLVLFLFLELSTALTPNKPNIAG